MDALTSFGLLAVTLMLICYALENRSHWWILPSPGCARRKEDACGVKKMLAG